MLRLPPFDYHAPKSVAEAVALKAECGETAMYSAGGTDLFPNMKRRQFTPQTLIGLRDLAELQKIDSADGMRIGSGVSLNQVAEHPEIIKRFPALAKAAAVLVQSSPDNRCTPPAVLKETVPALTTVSPACKPQQLQVSRQQPEEWDCPSIAESNYPYNYSCEYGIRSF